MCHQSPVGRGNELIDAPRYTAQLTLPSPGVGQRVVGGCRPDFFSTRSHGGRPAGRRAGHDAEARWVSSMSGPPIWSLYGFS